MLNPTKLLFLYYRKPFQQESVWSRLREKPNENSLFLGPCLSVGFHILGYRFTSVLATQNIAKIKAQRFPKPNLVGRRSSIILCSELRAKLARSWGSRRHQRAPLGRPRCAKHRPGPLQAPPGTLPGTPKTAKITPMPENGLARRDSTPFWIRFSTEFGHNL